MTLTNPSGQTKQFTPAEFYTFSLQVEKNSSFQKWLQRKNISARVSDGCGMILNTDIICVYLKEVGYICTDN